MDLPKIESCMSKSFATIKPGMPVAEASRHLITKPLFGGPVVNDDGTLAGWVSEQDCLKVTIQVVYLNQRVATVSEIMSKDVLTVKAEDDLLTVAQQMLEAKPKSYPVINQQNKVIGVITRRHILDELVQHIS